jgi:hypothetical protein
VYRTTQKHSQKHWGEKIIKDDKNAAAKTNKHIRTKGKGQRTKGKTKKTRTMDKAQRTKHKEQNKTTTNSQSLLAEFSHFPSSILSPFRTT